VASFVSLAGFIAYPTAPPRLAHIGIADTVSRGTVNLDSSSLHWLYNPYAAMPSVHLAYAVIVGLALWTYGSHSPVRAAGVVYPLWVAAEVLVTGNHFVLDVLAGAGVGAASWWLAGRTTVRRVGSIRGMRPFPLDDRGDRFDEPAAAA
jgi:membrane-associated phospholipid phosphatase